MDGYCRIMRVVSKSLMTLFIYDFLYHFNIVKHLGWIVMYEKPHMKVEIKMLCSSNTPITKKVLFEGNKETVTCYREAPCISNSRQTMGLEMAYFLFIRNYCQVITIIFYIFEAGGEIANIRSFATHQNTFWAPQRVGGGE